MHAQSLHLTLCNPVDFSPARLLCPWDFPGKNTGVGCNFLLQGIFLNQGSNLRLLHWQADSLLLSHQGSPNIWIQSILHLDHLHKYQPMIHSSLLPFIIAIWFWLMKWIYILRQDKKKLNIKASVFAWASSSLSSVHLHINQSSSKRGVTAQPERPIFFFLSCDASSVTS